MSKYTAEQVLYAAQLEEDTYDGDLIIVQYLRDYAALLRERESSKAAVTDEIRAHASFIYRKTTDGNCNELGMLNALEAVAPMLASARVPDARKLRLNGNVRQQSFDQGWNACRETMLAAAGEPNHDA